ncbi:MAG: putative quinol monooxygenase [bacterium]
MYVVCVTSKVKEEFHEEYLAENLENARNSRKEPGNLRFDVLQAEEDPNQFFFYEVYRSKDDFSIHQQTPHYLKWRDAVKEWMAEPRKGVKHHSLFPVEEEQWRS